MSGAHAALILAAGGSRRLGQPKQRLARGGEPLLRRTARLALATAPRRCLVVLGAGAAALQPLLDGLAVECLRNEDWAQGMGSSLARLRRGVQDDPAIQRCLILGCDQPALETAHLRALLEAAAQAACRCAVSAYAGIDGLPVVMAQAAWRDAPLQGDQGLRGWLARLPAAQLGRVAAPALALDLDTDADVAEARQRGWLDPA